MQQNNLLHKIVPHLSVLFPEFNPGMRLDPFLSILHAFHAVLRIKNCHTKDTGCCTTREEEEEEGEGEGKEEGRGGGGEEGKGNQELSHERHWVLYHKWCLCSKLLQVVTTIVDVNSSVSRCSYRNVWKGGEERRGGRRKQIMTHIDSITYTHPLTPPPTTISYTHAYLHCRHHQYLPG